MKRSTSYITKTLSRLAIFVLSQAGYRAKHEEIRTSRNKQAWFLLVFGAVILVLSVSTAKESDVLSLIVNILGTIVIFISTYESHCEAIKQWRSNNIPVNDEQNERTPYGSRLLIYSFLVICGCIAFIYRWIIGDKAIWIINYIAYFIECLDVAINALVIMFNAELVIE